MSQSYLPRTRSSVKNVSSGASSQNDEEGGTALEKRKEKLLNFLGDKKTDERSKFVCIQPKCLKIFNHVDSLSRHLRSEHFADKCSAMSNGIPCEFVVKDSRSIKKHFKDAHPHEIQPKRIDVVARTPYRHICLSCFTSYYRSGTIPFYREHFAILGKIPKIVHPKNGKLMACCRARPNIYVNARRPKRHVNKRNLSEETLPPAHNSSPEADIRSQPEQSSQSIGIKDAENCVSACNEKVTSIEVERAEMDIGTEEKGTGVRDEVEATEKRKKNTKQIVGMQLTGDELAGNEQRAETGYREVAVVFSVGSDVDDTNIEVVIRSEESSEIENGAEKLECVRERLKESHLGGKQVNVEGGENEIVGSSVGEQREEIMVAKTDNMELDAETTQDTEDFDMTPLTSSPLPNEPDWKSMYENEKSTREEMEEKMNALKEKIRSLQINYETENHAKIRAEVSANFWETTINSKFEDSSIHNKSTLRNLAIQLKDNKSDMKILEEQNKKLKESLAELRKRFPKFDKLPPFANKVRSLSINYSDARDHLQQIKDDPAGCLLHLLLSLKSDITAYPDDLRRLEKQLNTYEAEVKKYAEEYKKLNKRSVILDSCGTQSHLPTHHQTNDPDINVGPLGAEYIKRAMGVGENNYDPKGGIAVVDGGNVLCGYDDVGKILNKMDAQTLPTSNLNELELTAKKTCNVSRPKPRFEILVNWIEKMVMNEVFRSIVIVLREDMIFDMESEELLLVNDQAFIDFMMLVADPEMRVRLVVVPSPCYDDIIIVLLARELNGVIISRDRYRDLWDPKWQKKEKGKINVVRGLFFDWRDFLTDPEKGVVIKFTYTPAKDMIILNPDPTGTRGKNLQQKILKIGS